MTVPISRRAWEVASDAARAGAGARSRRVLACLVALAALPLACVAAAQDGQPEPPPLAPQPPATQPPATRPPATQPTATRPAHESLARLAPADVGIFVEVRNAEDLLTTFLEPQLWTALATLAGQPAAPEETRAWRRLIRQAVHMEPEEAVRVLLADGAAFVGAGLGRSQDAVVIARPPAGSSPEALLKRWEAKRIGRDQPATYWLYRNLGVAVQGRLMIFGDLLPPEGMFRHVLDELARPSAPRLTDDPKFRELLARVPPNPDGLCFVRFAGPDATSQARATSQPGATGQPGATSPAAARPPGRWSALPGRLGASPTLMLALHRDGPRIHVTAVGDAPQDRRLSASSQPERDGAATIALAELPAETLLAWSGHVDYAKLAAQLDALPEGHLYHVAARMLPPDASTDVLLANFDGATALVAGLVEPDGATGDDAPPLPAVALIASVQDEAVALDCLRELVQAATVLYSPMALARGLPPLPQPEQATESGVRLHTLDLTGVLPNVDRRALPALHVAWAVCDDALILASHREWLRRIVAARRGEAPQLAPALAIAKQPIGAASENAIVLQTGALADAARRWLDYLASVDAPVLSDEWWRERQSSHVRLGIDVEQDRDARRLIVQSVEPRGLCAGFLQAGDAIVGCNSSRFAGPRPIVEIRDGIAARREPGWISLLVERHGVVREVRVPVPFLNPVAGLRRMAAFGQVSRTLVYHDAGASGDVARGYLTVQLTPRPGASGAPASGPATPAADERP